MTAKPKPAPDCCALCRYCTPLPEHEEQGACRRFPPVPLMRIAGDIVMQFPIVLTATFSCGEFKPRGK